MQREEIEDRIRERWLGGRLLAESDKDPDIENKGCGHVRKVKE